MSEKYLNKHLPSIDTQQVSKVGGWIRRTKQVVYDNPWIEVSHEEVTRPNGTEGIYGVVHFKGRAIGVVPVDEQGNTWLVKQSRYACDEFTYEIPEGGGSFDVPPVDAARRELREETGLEAEHWEQIMTLRTSNSVTDEIAYVFLATGLTLGNQELEDTEDIELIKLPLKEAITMVLDGDIIDAISVAALLRLAVDPRFK